MPRALEALSSDQSLVPDLDFFKQHFFLRVLKYETQTFFQNLKFSKSHFPANQKMLILSLTASNHDLAAGAICHLFFMGWMLRFGRNGPSRAPHPFPRAVYPPGVRQ